MISQGLWDYLPGIALLIGGLAAVVRQIRSHFLTEPTAGALYTLRGVLVSSLSSVGSILLGLQLIFETLKHPWAESGLGAYGLLLLLLSLLRTVTNAAADYLRTRFPLRTKEIDARAIAGWIAATAGGYLLGVTLGALAVGLCMLLLVGPLGVPAPIPVWVRIPLHIVGGAVVGLAVGALQARVLGPIIGGARGWLWATLLAYALASPLEQISAIATGVESRADVPLATMLIARVCRGLLVGGLQSRVLRQWRTTAGWWIPTTIIASVTGYLFSNAVVRSATPRSVGEYVTGNLLSGMTFAVLTSVTLLLLQRKRAGGGTIVPAA